MLPTLREKVEKVNTGLALLDEKYQGPAHK